MSISFILLDLKKNESGSLMGGNLVGSFVLGCLFFERLEVTAPSLSFLHGRKKKTYKTSIAAGFGGQS